MISAILKTMLWNIKNH